MYGIYTLAAEERDYRLRTERERKEIDETERRAGGGMWRRERWRMQAKE